MLELVVLEILQPSLLPPSPLDTCLWMLQEAAGRKKYTWLVGLEVDVTKTHRHMLDWCLALEGGNREGTQCVLVECQLVTGAEHVASSWSVLLNSMHCVVISCIPSCICVRSVLVSIILYGNHLSDGRNIK